MAKAAFCFLLPALKEREAVCVRSRLRRGTSRCAAGFNTAGWASSQRNMSVPINIYQPLLKASPPSSSSLYIFFLQGFLIINCPRMTSVESSIARHLPSCKSSCLPLGRVMIRSCGGTTRRAQIERDYPTRPGSVLLPDAVRRNRPVGIRRVRGNKQTKQKKKQD